jgi:hypothetical protein
MTKAIITKQTLIDADAYSRQVKLFEETFGDSVVVTAAHAKKVAQAFDWPCVAETLLDATGVDEYKRADARINAKYSRDATPAREKYVRASSPAYIGAPIDQRALSIATDEFFSDTAPILAESQRACAAAFAKAYINMHQRKAAQS